MKKLGMMVLSLVLMSTLVSSLLNPTASANPILTETEKNDSFETATTIELNRKYTGVIEGYSSDAGSSVDYYKFTLPVDGNVIVTIHNQEGKNWYLDILTPEHTFNTLFSNNLTEPTDKSKKSSRIEVGLPAGTYYIKVTGSPETVSMPYSFETTYLQGANFEKEPNDTLKEATAIELNKAYSGVIEEYYDTWTYSGTSNDYFVFTLDKKTEIAAGIKNKAGSTWYMELADAKGVQLLKHYSNPNSNSFSSNVKTLEAGTYYIRMSGYNDAADKAYKFMVSDKGVKELRALNDISVYIDGEHQAYTQPPVLENEATLVPMRAIFEKLGATVVWNSKNKVVTAKKGETEIKLTIDSKVATVNNKSIPLAQPAKVLNGSTMIPLRFVSEALDANIIWIQDTSTIYIGS